MPGEYLLTPHNLLHPINTGHVLGTASVRLLSLVQTGLYTERTVSAHILLESSVCSKLWFARQGRSSERRQIPRASYLYVQYLNMNSNPTNSVPSSIFRFQLWVQRDSRLLSDSNTIKHGKKLIYKLLKQQQCSLKRRAWLSICPSPQKEKNVASNSLPSVVSDDSSCKLFPALPCSGIVTIIL